MHLALFDLDHTLLPIDSADTWSHHVVRRGGLDAAEYGARIRRFADEYHAGTFDVDAYVRFQVELLAAFPRAELDAWHAEFMAHHVNPAVRDQARALFEKHRAQGHELALVTGTNAYLVTPIARVRRRARAGRGARAERRAPHRRLRRHAYLPGRQGVRKVEEFLNARGGTLADTVTTFCSDSINDLPLLERVAYPVVTNGAARLVAIAHEGGWPTLQLFEGAHA